MNILHRFIPTRLVNGLDIFQSCDRHNDETATARKNINEYEHMRK